MQHITLFFCDILNTFVGKNTNNEEDIKKFVTNLEQIRKKNNSQYLLFTFASEEIPEEIKKLEDYFTPFISDSSIKIIRSVKNYDFKTARIYHMIKTMYPDYFIDEIYFADDCKIYHEIVGALLDDDSMDVSFNSIVTTMGGMIELNESLKDILENNKIKKLLI